METTTVKVSPRVRRLLLEADELIGEYGWRQGTSGNRKIGFCAVGALREVGQTWLSRHVFDDSRRIKAAFRLLNDCIGTSNNRFGPRSIVSWNDTQGRTKDEVRALLQTVARGECPE